MAFYEYKWNKNMKFMDTVYNYKSYKPNHCDPDLYTSIIGFYYNEDGVLFKLFHGFNKKCPNCKNDIFESSCYSCCHKDNCGKVNYGIFHITNMMLILKFNYCSDCVSYDTLNSSISTDIPSKLFHHICNNCQWEFYTLRNY